MVHSDSKLSMCGCRFYRIVTASVLNGIGFGFIKAGVHLKAVFTPLKIGPIEISCSHFKQYKIPLLITQINVLGCFMNFWVIFRYIWKEIIFLEGLVKLKEIRNVEDFGMF